MSNLSKILTITFIIAILIFFSCNWFKGCGDGGGGRIDTISVKSDTVYKDTGSIVIIKESYPVKVKGKDSLVFVYLDNPQPRPEPTDTAGIIQQYLSTYIYDSTYDVPYGKLQLIDTLSENRILGRRFDLKQSIPEITRTITIRERKLKVYAGPSASYPIGVGATIGLKFKDEMIILAGADLFQGQTIYRGTVLFPINFRK